MYTIVQFSPTGNTAYIAKLLSEYLGSGSVYALEHTNPNALEEAEHLIILYAIHAFNAPKPVIRFVNEMPSGKFQRISLIGVGCSDIWVNFAASSTLRKCLKRKSYPIIVDEVIAMPLTFILNFPKAVIKEQLRIAIKKTEELSAKIRDLTVSNRIIPVKSLFLSRVGMVEPLAARLFGLELHAKKSCSLCGKCYRECPEKNIKLTANGRIKFGFRCIMCMRCLYNCPTKSITPRMSKFIPLKDGYSLEKHLSDEV